ncbi:MAG: InlB B-repeat-containing protein [Clostridia bacterium]|nr:InlB B-repeat-containing protein [Clostridia bacterium]
MKKLACRLLSIVMIIGMSFPKVTFADAGMYTVRLFDGSTLLKEYHVAQGDFQIVESNTVNGGRFLKGWLTADGSMLYGYRICPGEDMDLYAFYGDCTEPVPGTNLFDNPSMEENVFDIRPSNGKVFFETDGDGNKILRYERGSGHASIQRYVKWEAGRHYLVSFRIKSDEAQDVYLNPRYTDSGGGSSDHGIFAGKNEAGKWSDYSKTIVIPDNHVPSEYDAISFFSSPGTNIENNDNLYDDLSLIPYFKISYDLNGGGEGRPENEYTLSDSYDINPSSVPERGGYIFKGWAADKASETPVTAVDTGNGDVTLYAIWELDESALVSDVVSYIPSTDKKGIADGTVSIDCTKIPSGYDTAELYFANDTGALPEYTRLHSMELSGDTAQYTMTGSRAFPKEATKIMAVLKGGSAGELAAVCDIPESMRHDAEEKPLLSFYAISDIHVGNDYWPEMTINRNNVAADIKQAAPDFVTIAGDLVDHGIASEYAELRNFLKTSFNDLNIPAFITNGNHELFNIKYEHTGYDIQALTDIYDYQIGAVSQNPDVSICREKGALFYSAEFKDRKLIFLSSPTVSDNGIDVTYSITGKQLNWLDEELYDGERSNKTTFVFSHIGLVGYNPYRDVGLTNSEEVIKILNKHPNSVIISGHTHSYLDDDAHYTVVSDMKTTFSALNDGCAVWLNAPYGGTGYFKDYSMGQYIEIYSDKILIKARQFTNPGKFISKHLYMIEIPDYKLQPGEASMEGSFEGGSTLTAKLDGEEPPEGSTFLWSIGNKIIGTDKSCTIEPDSFFVGKRLALRIILPDGSYTSCVSRQVFGESTVSYDLNGGSGIAPPEERSYKGAVYYPPVKNYFPVKPGAYFIGWSTDKNAVQPQPFVNIDGDTALYAVYTDKPEFHFDANLSGWEPTYGVASAEIKDSMMICTSGNKVSDLFFTMNNAHIDADKYKYLRIKMKLEGDTGTDGMYFETSESGFNETKTKIPFLSENIAASADGMSIYEFYIPGITDYWTGNVSKLRFDVISTLNGRASVDYVVFSDKKGIFGAEIYAAEPKAGEAVKNEAELSPDTLNCTVLEAGFNTAHEIFKEGKSYEYSVTLAPDEGYAFTTAEDLKANAKINGKKVTDAVINPDGTAVLIYEYESLPAGEASGTLSGDWEVWDGSVDAQWGGNYSTGSVFEINNASQFIAFRNMVLSGKTFQNKQIILNCNIDLNNLNLKHGVGDKRAVGWESGKDLTMFDGVFEGNGHIIRNLSMNPNIADTALNNIENSYCVGLFFISPNAQLLNLGLENVKITLHDAMPPADTSYGGLLSINSYGKVSDCYVKNIAFYGGWTDDVEMPAPYLGGFAARSMGGLITNSYADGVDFTNVTRGLLNINSRKTGLVCADGGAVIKNCYTAGIKYNINDTMSMSASMPSGKVMQNYDSVVYPDNNNDKCVMDKLYSEAPYRLISGAAAMESSASGTLEEAAADISSTLGGAFVTYPSLNARPRLAWEGPPLMLSYDRRGIYKDYGKLTETEITESGLSAGALTAELSGIKNETGIDVDGIICFTYVSGGELKKYNSVKLRIPAFGRLTDDVIVELDLSVETIKDGDFAQVIMYSETGAVPLSPAISLSVR